MGNGWASNGARVRRCVARKLKSTANLRMCRICLPDNDDKPPFRTVRRASVLESERIYISHACLLLAWEISYSLLLVRTYNATMQRKVRLKNVTTQLNITDIFHFTLGALYKDVKTFSRPNRARDMNNFYSPSQPRQTFADGSRWMQPTPAHLSGCTPRAWPGCVDP